MNEGVAATAYDYDTIPQLFKAIWKSARKEVNLLSSVEPSES
jgi:hypothetical protein